MPNIASALKSEISRIARKEVRFETGQLKKNAAHYRSEIAALNRRLSDLARQLRSQQKDSGKSVETAEDGAKPKGFRFTAKGFASQRQRLGLSARELAMLLGVSSLSVYKWEHGKARPRAKQLEAISQLRRLGKKDVNAWLTQMEP